MAIGGIPLYLEQVERGKSAAQNIDKICFQPDGLLRNEFDNLYRSLFDHPERYEKMIIALSSSWKGLERGEILVKSKMKDGGGITLMLQELEQSGFISSYIPFGKKKKDTLYRLTDFYSLFYLQFMKDLPTNAITLFSIKMYLSVGVFLFFSHLSLKRVFFSMFFKKLVLFRILFNA